jgi:hypothetical protein
MTALDRPYWIEAHIEPREAGTNTYVLLSEDDAE